MSNTIRITLPYHLRNMADVDAEIALNVDDPVTLGATLDALEMKYPMLRGTIREHDSKKRRAYLRFFVCQQDWSHEPMDKELPAEVISGAEPLMVIGAIAGG